GDAGLVGHGRGAELPGQHLAAETWSRLEERNLTQVAAVLFEEVCREESARSAADDGNPLHGVAAPEEMASPQSAQRSRGTTAPGGLGFPVVSILETPRLRESS